MRRVLAASLLLSPLFLTAAAVASTPASDVSASTQVRPISTGVIAPKIIHSNSIEIPTDALDGKIPAKAEVGLKLNVDAKGKAQDIQVVKSVNPDLDARVIEAVRQLRFTPAKLDNQAVSIGMDLNVVVQH
jgi:TonB family protein